MLYTTISLTLSEPSQAYFNTGSKIYQRSIAKEKVKAYLIKYTSLTLADLVDLEIQAAQLDGYLTCYFSVPSTLKIFNELSCLGLIIENTEKVS